MTSKVKALPAAAAVRDAEPTPTPETDIAVVRGGTKNKPTATKSEVIMQSGIEAVQGQVQQHVEKAMKTAEELFAFNQGNLEAVVKSSQIWFAGVQDLSKQFAANAQAQFEETVSAFKTLTTVKSLKEAVDLQSTLARSALEKSMSETGRLSDASFKLAEQAVAPIAARVTLAVEKFSHAV